MKKQLYKLFATLFVCSFALGIAACGSTSTSESNADSSLSSSQESDVSFESSYVTEGIEYDISADGTYAEVVAYTGTARKIQILDTYEELPVTNIYSYAFENTEITDVIIPNSVTSIGNSAFYNCGKLTSVTIPDSVTSIGSSSFWGCSGLTSITIPDSVTSIGSSAFDSCPNLQYNTFGKINYLGNEKNPYMLVVSPDNKTRNEYRIHSTAKMILHDAFKDCHLLTNITIPDSVTAIGDYAFSGCDNLTSITIPDSVTSIGSYTFYDCSSLTSVFYKGTATEWNSLYTFSFNVKKYYYSETKPTNSGYYWHYVDGVATPWDND